MRKRMVMTLFYPLLMIVVLFIHIGLCGFAAIALFSFANFNATSSMLVFNEFDKSGDKVKASVLPWFLIAVLLLYFCHMAYIISSTQIYLYTSLTSSWYDARLSSNPISRMIRVSHLKELQ